VKWGCFVVYSGCIGIYKFKFHPAFIESPEIKPDSLKISLIVDSLSIQKNLVKCPYFIIEIEFDMNIKIKKKYKCNYKFSISSIWIRPQFTMPGSLKKAIRCQFTNIL
jgi:hypothetical protein